MPKSSKAKLAYQAAYNKRPEEKEKGVERRRLRRELIRDGKVAIGDGKDIDHKKPLDAGGSHGKKNAEVTTQKENRGWRKKTPGLYGK
jgi:5-methylcytosine-specific restriction endonuclease McrA